MDVSVIIVSYNTKDITLNCIQSIYDQTNGINYEIIVVDNDSIDNSANAIKENFPNVLVIESKNNLGFGRANNLGVKLAKGEYLFFLNSDTVLKNNAIKIFYDIYQTSDLKKVGCIGSILENKTGEKIHSSGKFPSMWKILENTFLGYFNRAHHIEQTKKEKLFFENGENFFEVDYVTGADLFMRKDHFEKLSGFDVDFFMYYEETDLQKRMSNSELKQYIIKGPQIMHLVGASSKVNPINVSIMHTKSMFLYFFKHSKRIYFYLFRFFYLILRLIIIFDFRYTFKDRIKYIGNLFFINK